MAKQSYEGKRHKNAMVFKRRAELDYIVQVTLGCAASGGAAVGEILYAASRIDENDLESWIREWTALSEQVEAKAAAALEREHAVSAREAYLRAFNYYRVATYTIRHDDPRLAETVQRFRACFQQAAGLFDPPIESLEISCEGATLPGYFVRVDDSGTPHPTLIAIAGGESYCEESYLFFGPAALSRGYNLLMFDLPGQGVTALDGMIYRPDVEVPMSAAIDLLVSRPDVDPARIVACGVSLGGYAMMRSAAYEKRLAAVAASTPIIDFQQMMAEGWGFMAKMPAFAGDVALKLLGSTDPLALVALEKFTVAAGLKRPSDILTVFKGWQVDPGLITCPVLCMVGEGETQAFQRQAYTAYESLAGPKTLRVFTLDEGADGHCQANNFPLAQQVAFDWFGEVLQ